MNIDWSKAPEWADAHGLHETGFGIKEFWLGKTQHQNLEHAKSFPYGGGDRSCASFHNSRRESFSYVTPRPAPWPGEGLPPVGTVCEHKRVHEWQKVEIFAVKPNYNGSHTALFTYENGCWCGCAEPTLFRPIRTPEQIADDERKAATKEMAKLFNVPRDGSAATIWIVVNTLYEAGYRKQV
ncbi:hypothetical protein C4J88_2962 [Pseudomonas sp. R4-39-08]|uniref:hypothetical protein n=1 Tax=Pseudomonas sp. R4-39-08 TaxID=1173288 RepID=UPI000F585855|nr:hypothetical protein [Pseudomonas sp. R4-39-08]AZF37742.1 hypothetical protein C4J88_2962 [Pseudomonas sp. R4-39-08]